MGGGFEIALACDLIIASENAIFALPEPRVGLAALAGGLHRLPRADRAEARHGHDPHRAAGSRRKEGLELGFVNEVVAPGELMAAAKRWAELIAECSPMSIRASKQTIQRGLAVSLEQAISRTARISRREGNGRVAGLHRGTEGVFRKASAEMGWEVTSSCRGGAKRRARNLEIPGLVLRTIPE